MTALPVDDMAASRLGQLLRGKWRLDRLIGVGGTAAVYAATHRNGMLGAVKVLHPSIAAREDLRKRFLREGYVANRVGHPGAVRVMDDDVAEDGSVFLVMELLEGRSVGAIAADRPGGRLEVVEVLRVAEEVLRTLVAAHAQGIIHRDLKPDNLFWTKEGRIKVLDFGLARLRDPGAELATVTQSGIMGTPNFMPPEQALGHGSEVGARSDLWAMGGTMFALLTGRPPHEGDTLPKVLLAAMTGPPPPIGTIEPTLPLGVQQVVDRAVSFDQKDRFPDARSMLDAVLAVIPEPARTGSAPVRLEPGPPVHAIHAADTLAPTERGDVLTLARTVQLPPRRARLEIGVAIALAVVLAAAIGIAASWSRTERPARPTAVELPRRPLLPPLPPRAGAPVPSATVAAPPTEAPAAAPAPDAAAATPVTPAAKRPGKRPASRDDPFARRQ